MLWLLISEVALDFFSSWGRLDRGGNLFIGLKWCWIEKQETRRTYAEHYAVNDSLLLCRAVQQERSLEGIQVHATPLNSLIFIYRNECALIRKGKYFTSADMLSCLWRKPQVYVFAENIPFVFCNTVSHLLLINRSIHNKDLLNAWSSENNYT